LTAELHMNEMYKYAVCHTHNGQQIRLIQRYSLAFDASCTTNPVFTATTYHTCWLLMLNDSYSWLWKRQRILALPQNTWELLLRFMHNLAFGQNESMIIMHVYPLGFLTYPNTHTHADTRTYTHTLRNASRLKPIFSLFKFYF